MKRKIAAPTVSDDRLSRLVLSIRGHKVMLDSDLAALYGVPTKALNQAVQRNSERFPEDFMFRLTREEVANLAAALDVIDNKEVSDLRSQIVTSSLKTKYNQQLKKNTYGGDRYLPYAFTEQGVAMLSSVLRSQRAVRVNIAIMRAFVSLRGMMRSQENIKHELAALKQQYKDHDDQIKAIFLMIDEIIAPPEPKKKRKIGFMRDNEE